MRALLNDARQRLADARRETLGERREPRRILGLARATRIVPAGRAWHLGVLLLTDDAVLATGEVVRARADAIRGYTAESQRARAERAAEASRGGFADGESVHIGWETIDLEVVTAHSRPIAVRGGIPLVRWSAAGGEMPLAAYLDDRIDLLTHPPTPA